MANILKALSEGTNAAGGFTVPKPIADAIQDYIRANAVTIPEMDQSLRLQHETLLIPKLTAGSTASHPSENGTITGGDIAFGQTTLSAKKFAALMSVSTELLEDSQNDILAYVQQQFSTDLALDIDNEILGMGSWFTGLTAGIASGNKISSGALSWTKFFSGNDKVLAGNHPYPDVMFINPTNVTKAALLTDGNGRQILDQASWGSPLLREGAIGVIAGCRVKPTTKLTSSMIMGGVKGRMGYYAERKGITMNRFYEISTDDWILQANMRAAFAVKHDDAFYLLTSVS